MLPYLKRKTQQIVCVGFFRVHKAPPDGGKRQRTGSQGDRVGRFVESVAKGPLKLSKVWRSLQESAFPP